MTEVKYEIGKQISFKKRIIGNMIISGYVFSRNIGGGRNNILVACARSYFCFMGVSLLVLP